MNQEISESKTEDFSIRDYAMANNGEYWSGRELELESFIDKVSEEIKEIEEASKEELLPKSAEEARHIQAIWVLSGVGTYKTPVTEEPGDMINKDKPWIQWSDKRRIDRAADLIKKISIIASGDCTSEEIDSYEGSDEEVFKSIQEFGPFLVYNGVPSQNLDLLSAIEDGSLVIPKEKLFIPEGKIGRTLDQVSKLRLPNMDLEQGDNIVVVSHAPHLARVMRLINKYKPLPSKVGVELCPLVFEDPENEKEFTQSEIKGIIGYVGAGQASEEPYPYTLPGKKSMVKKLNPEKTEETTIVSLVAQEDMMDIFNLSNQDSVRANSIKSDKIELEGHKKWFASKLQDENTLMLKTSTKGKISGQVRLDIEGKVALIGVSVSEDFRGKGIGSVLLQAAIEKARDREVKIIEAFIRPENAGSVGLFEKNGWIFDRETEESGVKLLKYLLTVSEE